MITPSHHHIIPGYQPGLLARITEMHALYYARTSGFGQRFESVVAGGLATFADRLENTSNGLWSAVQDDRVIGCIAIDGEDLGNNLAHLRWFIVDDCARGTGIGKALLRTALAFVDAHAFSQTHLWTFSSLQAARHLYESHGFACVEEKEGQQWGPLMLEQRYVRPHR